MTPRFRRSSSLALLQILPAALLTGFVVLGGVLVLLAQAFGLLPVIGEPSFTVAPFLAAGPELPGSVLTSLGIAVASTAIAVTVGFGTAVLILQAAARSRLLEWTSTITLPVPHVVGAVAFGLLLSDGGVLPRMLHLSGARWPDLVGGPVQLGTVLEFGWKESAFVALVTVSSLATRVTGFDETAASLGAGPVARLRHVVLPLAAPALLIAGAIVFVYTMGTYEVPWLLGSAYPEALPVLSVRLYNGVTLTSRPGAAATAVITLVVSAAAAAGALAIARRIRRWR